MSTIRLQAALTVFLGAIAGGTTNAIAVWMLFHPYDPPRLFGRRIRAADGWETRRRDPA